MLFIKKNKKLEEVDIVTEIDERFLNILKILMSGQTIKSNGFIFGLAKTNTNSIEPFYMMSNTNRVLCDISFNYLYYQLKFVLDEDITIGLANIALKEINKKER